MSEHRGIVKTFIWSLESGLSVFKMSSGSDLFSARSSTSPVVSTTHQSPSSSSETKTLITPITPITASTVTANEEVFLESRRQHDSTSLATASGLMRRESVPASTSQTTVASRRSFTFDPRKMSEPGIIHKPSLLSPKRKPLPKGCAFDNKISSPEDSDLNGKLGKMKLTGGSTMVSLLTYKFEMLILDCWKVYVL